SAARPSKSSRRLGRAQRSWCTWPRRSPVSPHRRTMTDGVKQLRILLADDHVTVRRGLRLLIDNEPDMKVVSEASDGAAVLRSARELKPDVIVMDISMPGMNGLDAT